ncbi:MFS transporter [Sphingomonas yantingensis]|uniref:ACS family glucarate transporter-like MFS transporter n=1 Tax=Sphingomonas yantingensis TaxID=1241761 RepID=A0A7W9EJ24_9SPHN|nr:MFS transporter [Sphingomonas yantingensis]MBB5699792.1 ACS family glucarate transporter-like MFS transporter [Sphingomonas yantingensis]
MPTERRTRVRVGLVFLLFVISAIAFLDRTNISVAGVQMRQEYGIDQIQLGWVFSAFLIGYAAFQVPAGWLAARYGPRLLLTWALVWWGLFSIATALVPPDAAHAILMLAIVRFALGIGEAAVYPSANQFVSRWVPASERGKANGLIFAGVGAGSGLTPPLITAIIVMGGWRASFYVCAAIGIVVAVIWYAVARDRPQEHGRVSLAELAHIEGGLPPASPAAHVAIPWRAILSSRNVWGLFLSYFAFGYVIWIFFSWFFIYLAEARGLDLKASALYGMAPFLAMTVGCLGGGVLNDAISKRRGLYAGRSGLAMVAFVLTGIFLLIGSRVDSAPLAVAVLALGGGAIYVSQSSFWSVTADIAGRHTGVVSGLMNVGCQVGGAITSSLTPWIAAQYGWVAAFGTGAVIVLAGTLAWAVVDPNRLIEPAPSDDLGIEPVPVAV